MPFGFAAYRKSGSSSAHAEGRERVAARWLATALVVGCAASLAGAELAAAD
jgi:hypothetical protein